jgi:hypothetical protein
MAYYAKERDVNPDTSLTITKDIDAAEAVLDSDN